MKKLSRIKSLAIKLHLKDIEKSLYTVIINEMARFFKGFKWMMFESNIIIIRSIIFDILAEYRDRQTQCFMQIA